MLKALKPDDMQLRQTVANVSARELRLTSTQKQIEQLIKFVYKANNKGVAHNRKKPTVIGLSANQVGVKKRICIVDLAVRNKNYSDVHVLINPHITWYSKTHTLRREGCVNLPNVFGIVSRSIVVDVSFLDRWGNRYTSRMRGWCAVLLQHEVDHLNGKLFIDRLADAKRAHLVIGADLSSYKKSWRTWKKFIDVSSLRQNYLPEASLR